MVVVTKAILVRITNSRDDVMIKFYKTIVIQIKLVFPTSIKIYKTKSNF